MYEDIIKRAPPSARKRISEYAQCAEEEETSESLQQFYGVKDIKELVQHLTEFECGTAYDVATDKLIADYTTFWRTLAKVNGETLPDRFERR